MLKCPKCGSTTTTNSGEATADFIKTEFVCLDCGYTYSTAEYSLENNSSTVSSEQVSPSLPEAPVAVEELTLEKVIKTIESTKLATVETILDKVRYVSGWNDALDQIIQLLNNQYK